jgi:hypothetical protein
MTRLSWLLALGPTLVVGTGCEEQTFTPESPAEAHAPALALTLPPISQALFVAQESDGEAPTSGDAVLSDSRDDFDFEDIEDYPSGIYNAKTVVGFRDGLAFSRGDHWYTGNKGKVETTASVTYSGQPVGSQTAVSEGYNLFLLDFGRSKHVEATARVYLDRNCDRRVGGESKHWAWWEFWTGMAVSTWGKMQRSTSDTPRTGTDCEPEQHPSSSSDDDGVYSCWYLLTYDRNTGEILDAQFLACDDAYL